MPFRRSIFVSASEDRLQSLIEQRLAPGADKDLVDRRLWDLFGEHVLLGVGLGYGRVLRIGDSDVFGAEVNAAYILGEETARAYDILVTKAVREAAPQVEGLSFEEMSFDVLPAGEKAYRIAYR